MKAYVGSDGKHGYTQSNKQYTRTQHKRKADMSFLFLMRILIVFNSFNAIILNMAIRKLGVCVSIAMLVI